MMAMRAKPHPLLVTALLAGGVSALLGEAPARVPVLRQIALPHNYYYRELYLPQLTSGPSSACWTASGETLVFAMQGSLWRQRLDATVAEQLTDGAGADYQPDCSPDGRSVAFVRYDGRRMTLRRLDLETRQDTPLTDDEAVSVEPRWSPDGARLAYVSTAGTGHFLLHVADVRNGALSDVRTVTPDRRSAVKRYYYSPFDHAINPAWSRDGRSIFFVSNHEIAHGTGDLVQAALDGDGAPRMVQHEETSWQMRPDVSPDGTRLVYASYLGGQWHQLWVLPVGGGYPFPLTYGDYDNTSPRWSPDGRRIAFVSNRGGGTSLWVLDAFSGEQREVRIGERRYLQPHRELQLRVQSEQGQAMPARVSITDSRHRAHGPDDAWMHADDSLVEGRQAVETRYFHTGGESRVVVPRDRLSIVVARGPRYEVAHVEVDARESGASGATPVVVTLRLLAPTAEAAAWWSGDLHVHMNYGGRYRNTPERLAQMARAEDLDLVYNVIVNKEQRVPDVASFGAVHEVTSPAGPLVLHGQEFHSSYWGHLGLLGLAKHLIVPDYTAYPLTAAASPYPHNAAVADLAHAQGALVGYVHPFDEDVDPGAPAALTNELPVDAALGKIDYYEAVGFSDHLASNAVWYRLLNCGIRLPAGSGTDAMANYASLRGPVGLNRVFVPAEGRLARESFLAAVKAGRGVATNGPMLAFTVGEARPGDTLRVGAPEPAPEAKLQPFTYRASLRSNVPVERLEIVWNGDVVATLAPKPDGRAADAIGTIRVKAGTEPGARGAASSPSGHEITVTGPGWLLLRAWSPAPSDEVLDVYPFATTSPIYVETGGRPRGASEAGRYFLRWIDRLEAATLAHPDYRTEEERNAVLGDIERARSFYQRCAQ
jgi:hypothetical protein